MKILLVEDNKSIIKGLEYAFAQNGYSCEYCLSLDEAVRKAPFNYDAAVLDIMLPDGNGFDLFKKIRRYSDLPVIFLTAVDDEDSVVNGLELGADDYITKPFDIMELISRVNALLRRVAPETSDLITYKKMTLALSERTVAVSGKPVTLTYKEFEILRLLAENRGKVLTRDTLMNRVWGTEFEGESRTVDVHIRTLRQKLGEAAEYIETVRNVGYKLS